MTDITIDGAAELDQTLGRAVGDLDQIDQTAGAEAADTLARQAAQRAPRATGRLASSHRAQANQVAVTAPYAGYVAYGTRYMPGRPWLTETADRGDWAQAYRDELDTITHQIKGA